jgi:pimeloyl-ACP methyl ester carboxylesterase
LAELGSAFPNAFRAPIISDVPVLFVAGDLDGRTPISNAVEVAAGFSNGQVMIVENAGHNNLPRPSP